MGGGGGELGRWVGGGKELGGWGEGKGGWVVKKNKVDERKI